MFMNLPNVSGLVLDSTKGPEKAPGDQEGESSADDDPNAHASLNATCTVATMRGILVDGTLESITTTIDLRNMLSLRYINAIWFMYHKNLTDVILKGCVALKTIGRDAFAHCPLLHTVDFTGCVALTHVHERALAHCRDLETVNFAKCGRLEHVGKQAFGWSANDLIVNLSDSPFVNVAHNAFFFA